MESPEWTELASVLIWLVSGGGAGLLAFWLWGELEKVFPDLGLIPPMAERYITTVLTVLLAVGAFFLQLLLGYGEVPIDAVAWTERIFSVIAVAVLVATSAHGLTMRGFVYDDERREVEEKKSKKKPS